MITCKQSYRPIGIWRRSFRTGGRRSIAPIGPAREPSPTAGPLTAGRVMAAGFRPMAAGEMRVAVGDRRGGRRHRSGRTGAVIG
jgi:hypothetical protein